MSWTEKEANQYINVSVHIKRIIQDFIAIFTLLWDPYNTFKWTFLCVFLLFCCWLLFFYFFCQLRWDEVEQFLSDDTDDETRHKMRAQCNANARRIILSAMNIYANICVMKMKKRVCCCKGRQTVSQIANQVYIKYSKWVCVVNVTITCSPCSHLTRQIGMGEWGSRDQYTANSTAHRTIGSMAHMKWIETMTTEKQLRKRKKVKEIIMKNTNGQLAQFYVFLVLYLMACIKITTKQ